MATRIRIYLKTIKREWCAHCKMAKRFTYVKWDETAGGLAMSPEMGLTKCPECGREGGKRSMTPDEVATARMLILDQETARKAKITAQREEEEGLNDSS